jgi:hypothetical protein
MGIMMGSMVVGGTDKGVGIVGSTDRGAAGGMAAEATAAAAATGRGGDGAARLAERLAAALPPAYALNPLLARPHAAPSSLLDLTMESRRQERQERQERRRRARLRSLTAAVRAEPRKDANEMSEQKVLDLGGGGVEPGTEGFDPISATAEPNKQCREKANKYRTECLFGTAFNNDAP